MTSSILSPRRNGESRQSPAIFNVSGVWRHHMHREGNWMTSSAVPPHPFKSYLTSRHLFWIPAILFLRCNRIFGTKNVDVPKIIDRTVGWYVGARSKVLYGQKVPLFKGIVPRNLFTRFFHGSAPCFMILRFKRFDFFLVFAIIFEKRRASLMSETAPMQQ
jgi:hypothetical protein